MLFLVQKSVQKMYVLFFKTIIVYQDQKIFDGIKTKMTKTVRSVDLEEENDDRPRAK